MIAQGAICGLLELYRKVGATLGQCVTFWNGEELS
jgi:hypothetical protein